MKKRICALLLSLFLLIQLLPLTLRTASAETYSGSCGDNLTWTFDSETGVLTIEGSGNMYDFSSLSSVPWTSYRTQITKITFPDELTSIGSFAFYGCSEVSSITVPNGVASIGALAFCNCGNLLSIILPESLSEIGDHVIGDCERLKEITMPCSLTIIGQPFVNCRAVKTVRLTAGTGTMPDYQVYDNASSDWNYYQYTPWSETLEQEITIILDAGITRIGAHAFQECEGIKTIIIPDSVESIGSSAFYKCTGLVSALIGEGDISIESKAFSYCTALKTLTIGDGVASIAKEAFYNCSSVEEITLPCSVNLIDESVFQNCTAITKIRLTAGTGIMTDFQSSSSHGSNYYQSTPWYVSRENTMTITIDEGVKTIGWYAFSDCKKLKEITIPDAVTNIGKFAFNNCSGLTSITMPCDTGFESAFPGCTSITEIHLTNGSGMMPDHDGYSNLSSPWYQSRDNELSITLDDNITYIGKYTFYDCTGLKSFTVGNSVTEIGDYAFCNCTGLNDVYYNGTLRTRSNLSISSNNESLLRATWHYLPVKTIEMSRLPNKLIYLEGEKLDVTGGKIRTYYDFDIVEEETLTDEMVSGFVNAVAGLQTLTVTFGGQTTTFDVTVSHKPGEPVRENVVEPTYTVPGHYDEVVYCTACHAEISRETLPIGILCDGIIEWNADDVQFKGTTAYVIANGNSQTPRFTVKNKTNGNTVDPAFYDFEYRENKNAGTGYVFVTFKGDYSGSCRGSFKIYLPATTKTTIANIQAGIKLTWAPVEGAAGYVIYRRAWSSTTNGWTAFARWDNTTDTQYIDGADANHKVYAGTRYQYGVKAYFARRTDPVTGMQIGGNVNNDSGNFNLGEVGPLKTTVRITTRTLKSAASGFGQGTVNWDASSLFTGYQVRYATDSSFSDIIETITISNPKTTQRVIKNLDTTCFSGRTYYVRVRSYHVFNGMTYYGGWSETKQFASYPKYRALVIGESNYYNAGASSLPGCANDMAAFSGMLKNLSEPFCVSGEKNVSYQRIMARIDQMCAGTTEKSVSLFFFSGHGLSSGSATNNGALVTVDGRYLTFNTLAQKLSNAKGRVIVILDSCHSGASINRSANGENELEAYNNAIIEAFSGYDLETGEKSMTPKSGELKKSKFIVITAASSDQSSWDGKYDGSGYSQGAFTAALIKGMGCKYLNGEYAGSMPADKNKDSKITLKELYDYTYTTAYNWTKETGSPQRAQYYGPDNEVLFTR